MPQATSRHLVNAVVALLQETDLPLSRIASKVGLDISTISRIIKRELGQEFHGKRKERLKVRVHHSDVYGYRRVPTPPWWRGPRTGTRGRGYVPEHHLIYCEANKLTSIPHGYVVHHVNHCKTDNSLENLQLMTRSEHNRHHYASERQVLRVPTVQNPTLDQQS